MFGKKYALFMPSATMANLVAMSLMNTDCEVTKFVI